MTAGRRVWPVRLAATAETDFENIVRWTAEHFGRAQARECARTLSGLTHSAEIDAMAVLVEAKDETAAAFSSAFRFSATAGRRSAAVSANEDGAGAAGLSTSGLDGRR